MAGLYAVAGSADPKRLDPIQARMCLGGEAIVRSTSAFSFVWAGHDEQERYGPAEDPETGVRCVIGGRTVWTMADWQRASRLPFVGGLASRLVLEKFLAGGPATVPPFNGAAVVLVWDPRTRTVHIWTDQFGFHPAFLFSKDGRAIAFTTFPDAVAVDPSLDVRPDVISMVEFLRAWRTTPPNTYYEDLKHIGAASYVRWDTTTGTTQRTAYWRPFEHEMFSSAEEGSEQLARALSDAIRERTAAASRTALFVSGGSDSRVMLFGAAAPKMTWGLNLYESPTHESAVSRALCERSGVAYVGIGRDGDYYPRMLADNVRWSGAMWSAEDSHYLGVRDEVSKVGADLVMTACTTDWIFKGYGLERDYWRVLGRNLPIKRFVKRRVNGFLPNVPRPAPAEFAETVDERLRAWFDGVPVELTKDRDHLLAEERRIRPSCYTVSVSGQMMYRIFPYDTFLADSRVAECYGRTPARWKINGQIWGLAAARLCGRARDIEDSNFGWRVDAGLLEKLGVFTKGWLRRRLSANGGARQLEGHPPSQASWPDLGWYASHSSRLREFWEDAPQAHRVVLTRLWGANPWATPLDEWAGRGNDLMRILTLLQHWRLTPVLSSPLS